jgi:hypothetical protein
VDETYVYDKAKWHYEGDFPADLPKRQAFVHTGMYLGWIIDRGLYSEEFAVDAAKDIRRFKARQITGPQVYRICDGSLAADMLSEEGNAFSRAYFDFDKGRFLSDYDELMCDELPSMYHVRGTWKNYERLKARIDSRFAKWKARRS